MAAPHPRRPPAFFWQGVVILFPVIALAVVSLISLRQDERAVEADARSRASENARSLARALCVPVDEELHRYLTLQNIWMQGLRLAGLPSVSGAFPEATLRANIEQWERDYPGLHFADLALSPGEILADGRQLEPPDFPVAPRPPKWFLELSPAQMNCWQALRAGGNPQQMETWRQAFFDSQPSEAARQAVFDLFQAPQQMICDSNSLPTETGLSFEEIACGRLLTETNAQLTGPLLQSLWWHTVDHTSMFSPKLLELAASLTNRADPVLRQKFFWLHRYFISQFQAGACLVSLRQVPDLPSGKSYRWHCTQDGSALAIFQPTTFEHVGNDYAGSPLAGDGFEVWLMPRIVVEDIFQRALAENKFLIPAYVAPAVTVPGLGLLSPDAPAIRDEKMLLGEAEEMAGTQYAVEGFRFELKFYLGSREQMLAAERRRAKLFGALILGAVLAAVAGLLAARRAFRRQLQLNEEKSNFVSSVSHELRAPIASVRLMAENLARGKLSSPERQGEYFHFIMQECRRLSSLIENVLDFSRIEQGRKQYEFEPSNLVALTETTVKLMAPYAAEKGVRLEYIPALRTPIAELKVDGRALQQALVNLIDNAVKHSPQGETVTVGMEGETGGAVLLYVADHGPGIPAVEHEKIFERFYRLGSELRRETQGVGIGLSVVKHIVEAHGGRIRVRSEPGEGSRFTIELPAGETTNDTNKTE